MNTADKRNIGSGEDSSVTLKIPLNSTNRDAVMAVINNTGADSLNASIGNNEVVLNTTSSAIAAFLTRVEDTKAILAGQRPAISATLSSIPAPSATSISSAPATGGSFSTVPPSGPILG